MHLIQKLYNYIRKIPAEKRYRLSNDDYLEIMLFIIKKLQNL